VHGRRQRLTDLLGVTSINLGGLFNHRLGG
jgi:hypothetical protein